MRSQQGHTGKGRRVGRAAALVSAVVAAISLGVATPALADTYRLPTSGPGAILSAFTSTRNLKLCDTAADGRRAMAYVELWGANKHLMDVYHLADTDGANGQADVDCTVQNMSWILEKGDRIYLEVWVQDGADGAPENYNNSYIDL